MKALLLLPLLLVGCQTAQERFARRINCNVADTNLTNQTHAPGYNRTEGTCKGEKFVCTDAPFYSSCGASTGKEDPKGPPEKATPKPQ